MRTARLGLEGCESFVDDLIGCRVLYSVRDALLHRSLEIQPWHFPIRYFFFFFSKSIAVGSRSVCAACVSTDERVYLLMRQRRIVKKHKSKSHTQSRVVKKRKVKKKKKNLFCFVLL